MDLYQYTPLGSKDHIRVLHIRSGDGDCPIMCTLTQAALGDEPRYIALSYTWDLDESGSCEVMDNSAIVCDGAQLSVTLNLHAALKSFRCRKRAEDRDNLPFWIDAICINQKDKEERA